MVLKSRRPSTLSLKLLAMEVGEKEIKIEKKNGNEWWGKVNMRVEWVEV